MINCFILIKKCKTCVECIKRVSAIDYKPQEQSHRIGHQTMIIFCINIGKTNKCLVKYKS